MTLTFATIEDFLNMKDIEKPVESGFSTPIEAYDKNKIEDYLIRATRYIQRYTRRDFFPWVETREYPIPYAFHDLSLRRFPTAHLIVDQDLLEIIDIYNGVESVTSDYYYPLELNIKPHYAVAIKFPKYWGGYYGGLIPLRRYDEGIIRVTAVWGYAENTGGWRYPYNFWLSTNASLGYDLNNTDEIINITNAISIYDENGKSAFTKGRLIKIDDEFIEVMGVDDAKITVKRGARGTTAEEHKDGAVIYRWNVIEDITEATLQIAKTWREADISTGSRIGVSDVSAGAELSIPSDPLRIISSYHRSMLLE
jgi:hypothetical protein